MACGWIVDAERDSGESWERGDFFGRGVRGETEVTSGESGCERKGDGRGDGREENCLLLLPAPPPRGRPRRLPLQRQRRGFEETLSCGGTGLVDNYVRAACGGRGSR